MTIDEMFNELDNYKLIDTFIVTLKYKYDFEENYTIENQILEYDALDDSYVWLNDWYEGQTDVEVLGYMPLGDVDTTKPQPKTGKWVEENISEWTRKVYCSECGGSPPFEHVSNGDVYSTGGRGVIHKTKFCPNCGAKMEEES